MLSIKSQQLFSLEDIVKIRDTGNLGIIVGIDKEMNKLIVKYKWLDNTYHHSELEELSDSYLIEIVVNRILSERERYIISRISDYLGIGSSKDIEQNLSEDTIRRMIVDNWKDANKQEVAISTWID